MAKGGRLSSSSHDIRRLSSRLPLFIDTNLDTHLAIDISPNDMVAHLKGRIRTEHASCFPHIGEVFIQAMQVKRKMFYYNLSDSMPIKSAFSGTNVTWFLHLDLMPASPIAVSQTEIVGVISESGGQPEKHNDLNDELGVSSSELDKRLNIGGSEIKVTEADEVVGSNNQKEKEAVADHGNIGVEANVVAPISRKVKSRKRRNVEHTSRVKKKRTKENNSSIDVPAKDQLIGQNPEGATVFGGSGFLKVNVEGRNSHDDVCGACGDGGKLICCDSCPSTFHRKCLGLKVLPQGDWHCRNCICRFCGFSRVSSFEHGVTCLLLSCSQCGQKYHKECVPCSDIVRSNEDGPFCGQSCKKIFKKLSKVLGIKKRLDSGFYLRLVRRLDDTHYSYSQARVAKCNSKVAVALKVMNNVFEPFTDTRSKTNLIHNIIYNYESNFSRLNFSRFYTFVLEEGNEILSVASIRIHGTKLAELPFVCTANEYRGSGMLRRLLGGIESVLQKLKVEKLIVPVSSRALKDMWKYKFGFRPSKLQEIRWINIFIYPGLDILEKSILNSDLAGVTDSDRDDPSFCG